MYSEVHKDRYRSLWVNILVCNVTLLGHHGPYYFYHPPSVEWSLSRGTIIIIGTCGTWKSQKRSFQIFEDFLHSTWNFVCYVLSLSGSPKGSLFRLSSTVYVSGSIPQTQCHGHEVLRVGYMKSRSLFTTGTSRTSVLRSLNENRYPEGVINGYKRK